MCPVDAVLELRGVGDLPSPFLPASEVPCAQWHPKHHRSSVHVGAHEEPLPTAKMTRASDQNNPLIEVPDLDVEPSLVGAAHIGRDEAGSDLLAGIAIRPANSASFVTAGINGSLSRKTVQIELKPTFESGALAGSWNLSTYIRFCTTQPRRSRVWRSCELTNGVFSAAQILDASAGSVTSVRIGAAQRLELGSLAPAGKGWAGEEPQLGRCAPLPEI